MRITGYANSWSRRVWERILSEVFDTNATMPENQADWFSAVHVGDYLVTGSGDGCLAYAEVDEHADVPMICNITARSDGSICVHREFTMDLKAAE